MAEVPLWDAPEVHRATETVRKAGYERGRRTATACLDDVRSVVEALDRHHVEYVLVGGSATRLYGSVRVTKDVDFVPDSAEENLHRLAAALRDLGASVVVQPMYGRSDRHGRGPRFKAVYANAFRGSGMRSQ